MISIVPVYVQRNCKRNQQKQEQKIKVKDPKIGVNFKAILRKVILKTKFRKVQHISVSDDIPRGDLKEPLRIFRGVLFH